MTLKRKSFSLSKGRMPDMHRPGTRHGYFVRRVQGAGVGGKDSIYTYYVARCSSEFIDKYDIIIPTVILLSTDS